MSTTVTDPFWAKIFSDAGILATVHPDIQSWLRTHWTLTRLDPFVKAVAVAPADEPRMLIDEMSSAWPGHTSVMLAVDAASSVRSRTRRG
jgi:hypothetical protein